MSYRVNRETKNVAAMLKTILSSLPKTVIIIFFIKEQFMANCLQNALVKIIRRRQGQKCEVKVYFF